MTTTAQAHTGSCVCVWGGGAGVQPIPVSSLHLFIRTWTEPGPVSLANAALLGGGRQVSMLRRVLAFTGR